MILAIISAIVLAIYLIIVRIKYGQANMISDTYYQLKPKGYIFSIVLVFTAFSMLYSILDTNQGIQALAFLGCSGLAFVGCAPNYIEDYRIHKTAAIIASIGCVGWDLSVNLWITLIITILYVIYLGYMQLSKLFSNMLSKEEFHPWYYLELAGFIDTYLTYFLI